LQNANLVHKPIERARAVLKENPGLSIDELAARADVSRGTAQRALKTVGKVSPETKPAQKTEAVTPPEPPAPPVGALVFKGIGGKKVIKAPLPTWVVGHPVDSHGKRDEHQPDVIFGPTCKGYCMGAYNMTADMIAYYSCLCPGSKREAGEG
jgi:hypothetical protein